MPQPVINRRRGKTPQQIAVSPLPVRRRYVKRRGKTAQPIVPPIVPTTNRYRRAADTMIVEPGGDVLWCNGIDPMLRFTPPLALTENAGVAAPRGGPLSVVGSGTGNITGTFNAYIRYIDREGNPSSLSPISPNSATLPGSANTFTISGATIATSAKSTSVAQRCLNPRA